MRFRFYILLLLAMFGASACAGDAKGPTSQPAKAVKDDAPALQKLLSKGGRIQLDAGRTYNIASPITASGSFTIDGNGATLLAAPTLPINSQTGGGDVLTLLHCNNVRVRNLTIDANAREGAR